MSAAIGAGLMLLAKEGAEGPAGPRGARGATGARGLRGFEAEEFAGRNAEDEARQVQSQAYELEERIEELENEVIDVGATAQEANDAANSNEDSVRNLCFALPVELAIAC